MTDRDLDAWLAEHLNRWDWDDKYREFRAPLLSSTGDGMLLVIEACLERGWTVDMEVSARESVATIYRPWGDGERPFPASVPNPVVEQARASAGTLPLAVALAAKAALESVADL